MAPRMRMHGLALALSLFPLAASAAPTLRSEVDAFHQAAAKFSPTMAKHAARTIALGRSAYDAAQDSHEFRTSVHEGHTHVAISQTGQPTPHLKTWRFSFKPDNILPSIVSRTVSMQPVLGGTRMTAFMSYRPNATQEQSLEIENRETHLPFGLRITERQVRRHGQGDAESIILSSSRVVSLGGYTLFKR